jgi:hypothetical protein
MKPNRALDIIAGCIVWGGILLCIWVVLGLLVGVAAAAGRWVMQVLQ